MQTLVIFSFQSLLSISTSKKHCNHQTSPKKSNSNPNWSGQNIPNASKFKHSIDLNTMIVEMARKKGISNLKLFNKLCGHYQILHSLELQSIYIGKTEEKRSLPTATTMLAWSWEDESGGVVSLWYLVS